MEESKSRARSRSNSPASRGSGGPSAGLLAGLAAASVVVAGAVGAKIVFNRRKPIATPRISSRRTGQRRAIPPRRPRSVTSGGNSTPQSPKTAGKPAPVSQTRPTPLPSARPGLPLRPMPHVTARTQTKPTAQPPKPASSEEPAESSSGAAASAATTGLVALAGTAATAAVVASTKEESQPAAPVAEPSRAAEASEATANAEEKEELAAAPSAPETESHAEEPVSAPNKQEAEPKAPDEDEEPSEQPAAPAARPAGGEEAEAPAAIVEPSAEPEPEAPTKIEAPPAAAEVAAPVEASLSGEKTMGKVEEPIEPPFEQADKAETTAAVAEKTDSSPVVVQEATSSSTPTSITPAVAPAAISQTGASDVDSEEPSEADETNGSASSASGAASTEPVENENSEAVQAPADATLPQLIPDEADADVEGIDDVAIPAMRFDEAPTAEEPLNEMEVKVRDMSIHAHKLIKETAAGSNRLPAALKEQQAALDLCVGEGEGVGKVRPSLVAACAFQLGEMLLAHRKFDECKTAVAIGHSAAKEVEEGKGAVIRALMNYGNVLKSESKTKPRSVRETFQTALTIAREELGIVHATSEQVKMELVAQLLSSGRDEEAMNIMKTSVDDLLAEAERLSKEEAEGKEEQAKAAKAGSDAGEEKEEQSEGDAAVAAKETKPANGGDSAEFTDPGSGLEHLVAEQEGNAAGGDNNRLALRSSQAKHFAMRNLTTMSTLLDQRGQFDSSHDALAKAVELAIDVHGENSVPHMNVLYAVGQHMRRRGNLDEAIVAHETVLGIMDETIEVYDPELLQHRVSVLRDTAVLYDLKGDPESAVDYAQGALVNAQTLAKLAAPTVPRGFVGNFLEPYWLLLANVKAKMGDTEGAAEARREALRGKLSATTQGRGGKAPSLSSKSSKSGQGGQAKRGASAGASATRAGGRRV